MKRAITFASAVIVVATTCVFAGQSPPVDDFPIAALQYRDGARLFYLRSPYGFVARWENGRARYFLYDKVRTNIIATGNTETFVRELSSLPDGAEVAWVDTCGAPLYYGMPEEILSKIRETLKRKRFKMASIEDDNFVLCTCEATNLTFFTKAALRTR